MGTRDGTKMEMAAWQTNEQTEKTALMKRIDSLHIEIKYN